MKINRVKLCIRALTIAVSMSLLNCYGVLGTVKAEALEKQEITYSLRGEPKTLDPALCVDRTGFDVLANSFVGLCELDNNGKAIKGDAESWEISSDGLKYTFHLRKGLKWSNGDEHKASDYEYAWKRVLNPELACEYSFQLFYIKGAEAYNTGKGSADAVGIKAINDTTLVVTLESPTAYFLEMLAQPYYYPVNPKVVESNREWASNIKSLVSNGPFKVTEYNNNDKVVLEKNDNYYDKDKIKLDKLTMKFTTDVISTWDSYKLGRFDIVDTVPDSNTKGALKDGSAKKFPSMATYFLSINVSDKAKEVDPDAARVLSDVKVRKALSLAIDRKILVENVAKCGQVPAHGFVSWGIIGTDGKEYNEKRKYFGERSNLEEAKKLLAEAGYPDGNGLPQLTLRYNSEGKNGETMQVVQDMWRKIGVKVNLEIEQWKTFVKTREQRKYEIARDGWNGDYGDPMTFLEMYMSTSVLNDCGYSNSKYDELINMAKNELNVNKRYDLLHQAEDILIEDMPVIPLYYCTRIIGIRNYVKGINVSAMGNVYFKNVYVEGK